jgi:hypothetical protein
MFIVDETQQYARIARHAYTKLVEIERSLPEVVLSASDLEESARLLKANTAGKEEMARQAYVTVVFAAVALEGFINRRAISALSKTYFDKYLDRLDLVAKWAVIPRIAAGRTLIDQDGKAFQGLKKLVADRNRLVHPKIRHIASVEDIRQFATTYEPWTDARNAVATLDSVALELGAGMGDVLR